MAILPGFVSDPDWVGPRCMNCGRPVGGDGSMTKTCEDQGQAHMTFERIPPERREAFFVNRVWSNAQQALGSLLTALAWMAAPRDKGSVISQLERGYGLEVLEAQLIEFPQLTKQAEAAARAHAALRRAAAG